MALPKANDNEEQDLAHRLIELAVAFRMACNDNFRGADSAGDELNAFLNEIRIFPGEGTEALRLKALAVIEAMPNLERLFNAPLEVSFGDGEAFEASVIALLRCLVSHLSLTWAVEALREADGMDEEYADEA